MPIAPIVGKFRKKMILDLSLGIGLGFGGAYAFWYGFHLPKVARQENFYLKLEKEKLAAQTASS
ncbi:COX7A, subunit VIIa of cytochrome c oxidase [Mycena floridula]|nr:COX7A, subunit VIIa of cytochrome c oxidase [Mycena floridula]